MAAEIKKESGSVQKRLEALREQVRQEDLHDTTLHDEPDPEPRTLDELESERKQHLAAFAEKLAAFRQQAGGGGSVPGLEALDGLLKGGGDGAHALMALVVTL